MSNKRFNPNPTASGHSGCHIAAQSKLYKLRNLELTRAGIRKTITYKSTARGGAPFINMAFQSDGNDTGDNDA